MNKRELFNSQRSGNGSAAALALFLFFRSSVPAICTAVGLRLTLIYWDDGQFITKIDCYHLVSI